jgi:MFS family permease
MLSVTVPIYQCEIAPGHERGLLVSIKYLCLNPGYALSTWVRYAFFSYIPHEISWRGPYIIQACLAVILVTWAFFLPETPR